jgi:arylsulfatase A
VIYLEIHATHLRRYGASSGMIEQFPRRLGYRFFLDIRPRNAAHDRYGLARLSSLRLLSGLHDVLAIHECPDRLPRVAPSLWVQLGTSWLWGLSTRCWTRAHGLRSFTGALKGCAKGLTVHFLLVALLLLPLATLEATEHPKIILILADDLGYGHLGSYGQTKIRTPNLDRLAAEGLRLTQAYAGSTVCAPSRASLLTGLHTGHTPIRGNRNILLPPESVDLAEVLKQAGYVTAVIGKWGLGSPDQASSFPTQQGFDEFFGYLDHISAQQHYPGVLWRGEKLVGVSGYSDDLFTAAGLDFIEQHRNDRFFLYLAYTLPHAAVEVPAGAMAGYDFPEEPYDDYRFGKQERPRAAFAGMVSRLDDSVGAIIAKLETLGIAKDTLVLFTSDNGPADDYLVDNPFFGATGGLRGSKNSLYEGGIRVPMIAWWPSVIKPGETDHVIAQWDVLPTLAELAGVEVRDVDGLSFLPLLYGGSPPEHAYLYWEQHDVTTAQAVRFGDWKALREAPDGVIELYDLAVDPGETMDIADQHPDVVAHALAYMRASHQPDPEWPLQGHTLWTELQVLKGNIGGWAREQQAHHAWFGWIADVWNVLP